MTAILCYANSKLFINDKGENINFTMRRLADVPKSNNQS